MGFRAAEGHFLAPYVGLMLVVHLAITFTYYHQLVRVWLLGYSCVYVVNVVFHLRHGAG